MLKGFLGGSTRNTIPAYRQFEAEARKRGARFIEAEHMLLALATSGETEAGRVLIEAGLGRERIAAILRDEFRATLAFAGVRSLAEWPQGQAVNGAISLGTSAKAALRRAIQAHHAARPRRTRLDGIDLLVGILEAELGTVPRALALAGIDRSELIARAWAGRE